MGIALFPVFERDLPGLDYMDFFGKGLAHASDTLHAITERIGVASLYCLIDDEELGRRLSGEDSEEEETDTPEPIWFPADEGLKTVNALLDYVTHNPEGFREPEAVLYDLDRLKLFLDVGQQESIRFHLEWDF